MSISTDLKESIEARKAEIESRKSLIKSRADTARKAEKAIKLLEDCGLPLLTLPGSGKTAITLLKEAVEDIEKMQVHHKQAIAKETESLKAEVTALKALTKGGLVND